MQPSHSPDLCGAQHPLCAAAVRRRPALVDHARRWVGDDAEDVVQSAIERAIAHSVQLREPARAPAWLSRIVRSAVVDEIRRRRRRKESSLDESRAAVLVPVLVPVACACVVAQLDQIRGDQAALLRRVILDGVSISTLAGDLGVSANADTVRLHRARRALGERMEAHCWTATTRSCDDCGCGERGCCPAPEEA